VDELPIRRQGEEKSRDNHVSLLCDDVLVDDIGHLLIAWTTLICAIRLHHAHLSAFHTILNIYHHMNKMHGLFIFGGCYMDE
jgi:hypothetical protein